MPEKSRKLSQAELNDWIRDLEISKSKAELLASRMKECGFLERDVNVTFYRNRDKPFSKYYTKEGDMCYCKDIAGLFKEFNQPYEPQEWRLFIDGCNQSLKAVLLHNGNRKPSIPIAHAVNTKETYTIMAKLLQLLRYVEHNWKVCADLKMIAILCGLQGGFTKFCCFLCKWDSRARQEHYVRKNWPPRTEHKVGEDNIKFKALIDKEDVILPPLHIKLGLMKNFVKALDKESSAFRYLKTIFPHLSDAKIKEGVFVGPQITKLLNDENFEDHLSEDELAAWNSFRMVVACFLGNNKSRSHGKVIADLLKNYAKIGMKIFSIIWHLFVDSSTVAYFLCFSILFI